jgi:3',5'-cyclic AMP phosphodiesterase CpdA
MRTLSASTVVFGLLLAACSPPPTAAETQIHALKLQLPERPKAVRFAVIGDTGTGGKEQYQVGAVMAAAHRIFRFDFVLMLGDNIYGRKTPEDFKRKFEDPYKTLLDDGVKFYASLGNHDDPNERYYKPFNMNGQRYYTIKKGDVEFFALDSTYFDPQQLDWLQKELSSAGAKWKICFFHHPLYSDARYHGPDTDLKRRIEPILQKNAVDIVLSGHEHVYERIKPQGGVHYFVLGNAGQLRPHDLRPAANIAKGFDTDRAFMLMEVAGDDLYFQTISRTGETVDSGDIKTRQSPAR